MPRLLFEKKGRAVWVSHLDLMRIFQRAFKRAGLPLTHTQGFNPRPSVSIALPLSVGIESGCELLDFDLDGLDISLEEIQARLNRALVEGVKVCQVYSNGRKIRDLSFLQCAIQLCYDAPVEADAIDSISALFSREEIIVPKKTKSGIQDQNIIPMIQQLQVNQSDKHSLVIDCLICCQNPSLNPAQLVLAIEKYLPSYRPDYTKISRIEVYDTQKDIFR